MVISYHPLHYKNRYIHVLQGHGWNESQQYWQKAVLSKYPSFDTRFTLYSDKRFCPASFGSDELVSQDNCWDIAFWVYVLEFPWKSSQDSKVPHGINLKCTVISQVLTGPEQNIYRGGWTKLIHVRISIRISCDEDIFTKVPNLP